MSKRSYLQRFGDVELAVRRSGQGVPLVWGQGLHRRGVIAVPFPGRESTRPTSSRRLRPGIFGRIT